jgi:hypothetical protein
MATADAFGSGADPSLSVDVDPALGVDAGLTVGSAPTGTTPTGVTTPTGTSPTGASPTGGDADPEVRALRRVATLWAAVLLALALVIIVLSVGIGLGWGWTGFQSNGQLWDWLHLLLLPMVLALLPLWWKTQEGFRREWTLGLGAVAAVFVVLLLGGYRWGWTWTGFTGNTLWDWLELLVLPVSAAMVPIVLEIDRPSRRTLVWTAPPLALFLGLVAGGYLIPWLWTGFRGNTLWDWIQLLLVPFLIPGVASVLTHRPCERPGKPAAAAAKPADPPAR